MEDETLDALDWLFNFVLQTLGPDTKDTLQEQASTDLQIISDYLATDPTANFGWRERICEWILEQ